MGIEQARDYLKARRRDGEIIEFSVSSATVELAAQALNIAESRIAKTLAFKIADRPILVVTAGTMKIDNKKFKDEYGYKASMLSPDEVLRSIGHEVGGVCPFGVKENIDVYLDVSLKRFDYVFPACGSSNSAIKLNCQELEELSQAKKWVDVCREKEVS